MRAVPVALAVAAFASAVSLMPSFAAETSYIDDRSSATALVNSLYNAVNRHEYARAWDYFGETKPSADFNSFAAGYEAIERIEIMTGNVASEGAAGSTFYYVPVAILSIAEDGSEKVFAGCYTARLVSPQIQEPPFRPLHLEKGSLQPADANFEDAVPAGCPDAPSPENNDTVLQQAQAAFSATHGDCEPASAPEGETAPLSYMIPYRYKADADDQLMREARLFRFFCSMGAYNITHLYYLQSERQGLRELQFATPDIDIRYEDDNSDGKVDSVNIVGYLAADRLVNSSFDESTQSISSHSLWRGVGDTSSSGLWIFRDGDFTLVKYEVDASYDGEINPQTVLDYDTAP